LTRKMRALHYNRHRLSIFLIVAMVFTVAGVPAFAAGCGQPPLAGALASNGEGSAPACGMADRECCCGPKAGVSDTDSRVAVSASPAGCGCALEAPRVPPAVDVRSGLRPAGPPSALLARASTPFLPSLTVSVPAATRGGRPRPAYLASVPSRAPPAC